MDKPREGSKASRLTRRVLLIVCAVAFVVSVGLWVISEKRPFHVTFERDVPYTGPDAATRPQTMDRCEDYFAAVHSRLLWRHNRFPSWIGDRARPDTNEPLPTGLTFGTVDIGRVRSWNEWYDEGNGRRARVLGGLGVYYYAARPTAPFFVFVPLYLTTLLAAAPLAVWGWARWRTIRRIERGECTRCGYARYGLTPNAPCPECGNLPATPATSPPPASSPAAPLRSRP